MYNNEIDSITFSQFELPEKYYKFGADTIIMHDTIYIYAEVHDTIYIEKPETPANELVGVDLALPSGTLWANMNLNATAPEELGGYYAWGEAQQKYNFTSGSYTESEYKDAANIQLGEDWCIPTSDQLKELMNYCKYEEATINNVTGCRITGSNGNSIFLPYSGIMIGRNVYYEKYNGFIMSKEIVNRSYTDVITLMFNSASLSVSYSHKFLNNNDEKTDRQTEYSFGYQIRPIMTKK